jgi:N-acetylglucosaminyldiphosphoundecaprenol N-acetyl-beta-D-mannosaminyltransferase
MVKVISRQYPDAVVAGIFAPPFRPFSITENETYIEMMKSTRPDIIWVSLGAPKQELWIHQHYQQLDHGLFIGVGAGFNYLAGTIKHAPEWMKHLALEWLYRLFQEPARLFRRYLVYNTLFIFYLIWDAMVHPHPINHRLR